MSRAFEYYKHQLEEPLNSKVQVSRPFLPDVKHKREHPLDALRRTLAAKGKSPEEIERTITENLRYDDNVRDQPQH
jgi:hypothetical protein